MVRKNYYEWSSGMKFSNYRIYPEVPGKLQIWKVFIVLLAIEKIKILQFYAVNLHKTAAGANRFITVSERNVNF
jgi:hypothetical protein